MLNKNSLLAALSLGLAAGSGAADIPVPAQPPIDFGWKHQRTRTRAPFGNTVRYGGQRYHTGTAIVAGVPGAKLARKAAEGRLGLPRGVRGVIINAK